LVEDGEGNVVVVTVEVAIDKPEAVRHVAIHIGSLGHEGGVPNGSDVDLVVGSTGIL
jgi:hypothetical protein